MSIVLATVVLTVVGSDGVERSRSYKTIEGARRAAMKAVTAHPKFDGHAVHPENPDIRLSASGCSYWVLFPEEFDRPKGELNTWEDESVTIYWSRLLRVSYDTARWVTRQIVARVRERCSTEIAVIGSQVAQEWTSELVRERIQTRYRVRVCHREGPGEVLFSSDIFTFCRETVASRGFEYDLGVCVEDQLTGLYSFRDLCWVSYGEHFPEMSAKSSDADKKVEA